MLPAPKWTAFLPPLVFFDGMLKVSGCGRNSYRTAWFRGERSEFVTFNEVEWRRRSMETADQIYS